LPAKIRCGLPKLVRVKLPVLSVYRASRLFSDVLTQALSMAARETLSRTIPLIVLEMSPFSLHATAQAIAVANARQSKNLDTANCFLPNRDPSTSIAANRAALRIIVRNAPIFNLLIANLCILLFPSRASLLPLCFVSPNSEHTLRNQCRIATYSVIVELIHSQLPSSPRSRSGKNAILFCIPPFLRTMSD